MKKIDFNRNWTCRCLTRDEEPYSVTLPHDAMRSEPRTEESVSEGNSGWYLGGDYEYTKHVFVPSEYSGKKVLIEFESVYHNAEVYINGTKAAYRPYGYTNFYRLADEPSGNASGKSGWSWRCEDTQSHRIHRHGRKNRLHCTDYGETERVPRTPCCT